MRPIGLALAALSAVLGACGSVPDCGLALEGAPDRVARWETFENAGTLGVPVANPFDPDEVDLRAELANPDGAVQRALGFYHRAYERSLEGGRERLVPRGEATWRVRFTPRREGSWRWRWVVRAPGCVQAPRWRSLEVGPARAGTHGFLQVASQDPHSRRSAGLRRRRRGDGLARGRRRHADGAAERSVP